MKAESFVSLLKKNGINDFTGVPCSVFKEVIHYLENNENYLTATNEGEAMGIAAGISLAGKIPGVFMQNDGFGNAINPITSLHKLYKFPVLLIISWRGEPGIKDAPQHVWSGKTLLDLLKVLHINYTILDKEYADTKLGVLIDKVKETNSIGVVICRKGTFVKEKIQTKENNKLISRKTALQTILDLVEKETPVFSTTGKPSREIYDLKDRSNNFYVVGSMGCTSAIAYGFYSKVQKKTVIIDGDGAVLMHLGNLATIGYYQPEKILHICLDNETYESTGGQIAVSKTIDLGRIAKSCQYKTVKTVNSVDEIKEFMKKWNKNPSLSFLHIKVKNITDPDLGRPKEDPVELKNRFMN